MGIVSGCDQRNIYVYNISGSQLPKFTSLYEPFYIYVHTIHTCVCVYMYSHNTHTEEGICHSDVTWCNCGQTVRKAVTCTSDAGACAHSKQAGKVTAKCRVQESKLEPPGSQRRAWTRANSCCLWSFLKLIEFWLRFQYLMYWGFIATPGFSSLHLNVFFPLRNTGKFKH